MKTCKTCGHAVEGRPFLNVVGSGFPCYNCRRSFTDNWQAIAKPKPRTEKKKQGPFKR